jgi:hypothetical protein
VQPDLPATPADQPQPQSQQADGPVAAHPAAAAPGSWPVGTVVRLLQRPSYFKTADPMPMLRPPDLVGVDETGQVVEQRALGQLAVRFRRGTFLVAAAACAPVSS